MKPRFDFSEALSIAISEAVSGLCSAVGLPNSRTHYDRTVLRILSRYGERPQRPG